MILPQEIVNYIHDFIRPLPTLRTIVNWRNGSIKFDINELKCAYVINFNEDLYIKKVHQCIIHNYDIFKQNPYLACNCSYYHVVRPYYPPNFIWNDNYLALWKFGSKGNKLIWNYVDIDECDYCNEQHLVYHLIKIGKTNICDCCYSVLYSGV